MNNYTKIISHLKEKILNFSKNISKEFSVPTAKFITSMLYGLCVSTSAYLSNIARALHEDITLKKVIERLSNHLANFGDEDCKIVWCNYITSIKDKIDENTVFCCDPGDLGKKYSKKLEALDIIKDGSTGETIPGYKMMEIVALTEKERLPIPVSTRLFSTQEEEFISENDEYMKCLKEIENNFGNKGTYALDRGFDDQKYFEYFANNNLGFVIRLKANRKATEDETSDNIKKIALKVKTPYGYTYKDKDGIIRNANSGYTKIKIPAIKEKTFYLVVVKSTEFPNDPMMLITNMNPENNEFTKIVNKVYIARWKIEEYFKFKKQQFQFEKMLLRSLNSIRALNALITIVIGFIGIFSDNQGSIQYKLVFDASDSIRKNKDIRLVFYAVARGFNKLFGYDVIGIKNFLKKPPPSEQLILSEFASFNLLQTS